ncbi:MAG: hypothetical protein ACYCQJ_12245 [Nitrososphaerales archaeon]
MSKVKTMINVQKDSSNFTIVLQNILTTGLQTLLMITIQGKRRNIPPGLIIRRKMTKKVPQVRRRTPQGANT